MRHRLICVLLGCAAFAGATLVSLTLVGCDIFAFGEVAAPVITPESTDERILVDPDAAIEIGINSETDSTVVYYTTDSSDPSPSNGILYESPFSVDSTVTVKAMAYHERRGGSEITSADFVIYRSVSLPAGSFSFDYSSGAHATVYLDGFLIMNHEITAGLWNRVAEYASSELGSDLVTIADTTDTAALPAADITWYDAAKWCNAFSKLMGLTPVYYIDTLFESIYILGESELVEARVKWDADGFRLPTVPEWEYAARYTGAGNDLNPETSFSGYVEGSEAGDYAWFEDNSDGVRHRVGLKAPAAVGLYDMHGNVAEWCWIAPADTITDNPVYNPRELETARPVAGGSYLDSAGNIVTNIAVYDARNPTYPYRSVGLRPVRPQSP